MRRAPGAAIARDVLLAVDTSYDHRLRLGDRVTHSRHQGAEHRHIVARGFNHDDGRIQAGEVLRNFGLVASGFGQNRKRGSLESGPFYFGPTARQCAACATRRARAPRRATAAGLVFLSVGCVEQGDRQRPEDRRAPDGSGAGRHCVRSRKFLDLRYRQAAVAQGDRPGGLPARENPSGPGAGPVRVGRMGACGLHVPLRHACLRSRNRSGDRRGARGSLLRCR